MSPEDSSLRDFVCSKNIEAYRRRLAGPVEPAERKLLLKLLEEEEAKLPPARQGRTVHR